MYNKITFSSLIVIFLVIGLPLKAYSKLKICETSDKTDTIQKTTVFSAGEDGIDSYRIPSLVTSRDGTLLLFTEARKLSSTDKTPTDIALKRSVDNGETWSDIKILTQSGNDAYMDPVAVVDKVTGRIFLFTCLWPANDHSTFENTAWLITSDDDGITWSEPKNITTEITAPNHFIGGFGPGAGVQIKEGKFQNRLIIPTRQRDKEISSNRTIFSDDNGSTWQVGHMAPDGGEYQIAESSANRLIYNLRGPKGKRVVSEILMEEILGVIVKLIFVYNHR